MSVFDSLTSARIGGNDYDQPALTALMMAGLCTSPALSMVNPVVPANLAAIGAGYLAYRFTGPVRDQSVLPTTLDLVSSPTPQEIVPELFKDSDGFLLGYTTDNGKPVRIPDEDLMRHLFFAGQSGVGKTVLGRLLMYQQMQRGGGLLFVDGKMNSKDIESFYHLACMCNRQQDVIIINPGNPSLSNTYNPILYGDPDEVSARILSLIPSTESNAGADYYKQSANQGIATIVASLQALGLAYNMIDLCVLLMNPRALAELETKLQNKASTQKEKDAAKNLSYFLDMFRGSGNSPQDKMQIDIKKMRDLFGGIGGKLFLFGTNKFGEVCNTYDPDLNMFEAIKTNKIIYVALPTMAKDIAAQNFGKMVIGDFRTAVAWVQDLPEEEQPDPPFLNFSDEAGSYASDSWARIYEQSRSSKIFNCPAVQTFANFRAISDELHEMIFGNTWTKVFFKLGTQETAEEAAEMIGNEMKVVRSLSDTSNTSSNSPLVGVTPEGGLGDAQGITEGEREQEDYRVSADQLKQLDKGEAIILWAGHYLYNVRIPLIKVDKQFAKQFGKLRINHRRRQYVKGADFFANADRYLTKNDKNLLRAISASEAKKAGKESHQDETS